MMCSRSGEERRTKLRDGEFTFIGNGVEYTSTDRPFDSVADNPPGKELTLEECERVVIALLLEGIFSVRVAYNAYDSVVYWNLGNAGHNLLASPDPKVVMTFPRREGKKGTGDSNKSKARKAIADEEGWLSAKKPAKRKNNRSSGFSVASKKNDATTNTASRKRKQSSSTKGKPKAKKRSSSAAVDVIELSSSDDEPAPEPVASSRAILPRAARTSASMALRDDLWDDSSPDSDEECEFES